MANNPLRHLYKRSYRLRRIVRRVKNAAVYWPTRWVLWAIDRMPLDRALALGERAGALLFHLLRAPRRLALEHVRLAFGDALSPAARERLARASFINIARCFCEVAKIEEIRASLDSYIDADGMEHLEAALAQGKGAVVITGHIGNWELLAAYFAHKGFPVAAIARRIYEPRLNHLLVAFREGNGVKTIVRESPHATRDMLHVLKTRGVLAMLIDQDTKASSVSVPFFGRAARTPAAAAALAVRRGLPALAVFIQRRPEGGHRITVLRAFAVPATGDERHDVRELTAAFNQAIEAQIRKNSAEWVWWHRRWHRAPIRDLDLDRELPYAYSHRVLHEKTSSQ
jgi:KDO2-lipid IV(A) lauroyltransferase